MSLFTLGMITVLTTIIIPQQKVEEWEDQDELLEHVFEDFNEEELQEIALDEEIELLDDFEIE